MRNRRPAWRWICGIGSSWSGKYAVRAWRVQGPIGRVTRPLVVRQKRVPFGYGKA
jgi:hypothetical protein